MPWQSSGNEARLKSRPAMPRRGGEAGLHHLLKNGDRETLLFVPPSYNQQPAPLVVSMHGAGGDAVNGLDLLRSQAARLGFLLLAPASIGRTWDFIVSGFGPDVAALDGALRETFDAYHVDARRLAVSGFSDGASYALSLAVANGGLFSHAIAFSPGFMTVKRTEGHPSFYVSHGTRDEVLPIASCSRRLVPRLRDAGYTVSYREFPGGHAVPGEIRDEAMEWFLGRP